MLRSTVARLYFPLCPFEPAIHSIPSPHRTEGCAVPCCCWCWCGASLESWSISYTLVAGHARFDFKCFPPTLRRSRSSRPRNKRCYYTTLVLSTAALCSGPVEKKTSDTTKDDLELPGLRSNDRHKLGLCELRVGLTTVFGLAWLVLWTFGGAHAHLASLALTFAWADETTGCWLFITDGSTISFWAQIHPSPASR
ncbi:hypothetical protein B0T24DRAFT_239856 [Lasiosphaeria ovina]|uniref:Uncharacterized protein n=1 Tax=Lasiosphaeria ovina TaxID=92902 RepID=A0AAE0NB32_9PEZI|nr:hypothetical protein B0T24DRAFT_239856 [Lasiosphaeria ovina]